MSTFVYNVGLTDASVGLYTFKSQSLVSVASPSVGNWSVTTSGTGVSGVYAQRGDVISSASVLLNARAWWVMRGHALLDGGVAYSQQQCWQVDGVGSVRVKVSVRGGFTGGSPSPQQVPSASDERVWLGGGTDANPTYEPLFPTSAAWLQGRFSECDDSYWFVAYPVGGGPASALLLGGVVPPQYDGTGGLLDRSPHYWYARTGSTSALATSLGSEQWGPLGLLAATDPTREAWVRLPATARCLYDSAGVLQPVMPGHLTQSPSYPAGPVYAQDTLRLGRRLEVAGTSTGTHEAGNLNTTGDKGEESYARWSGKLFTVPTLLDSVSPTTGLTVTGTLVGAGHLTLPWELGLPLRDGA